MQKHGLDCLITADIKKQSDVHVVIGPWYAKNYWLNHPNVILIDRCYYKGDPFNVSVGWMMQSGDRVFKVGNKDKERPVIGTPTGNKTIFLADYHGPIEEADIIRFHPSHKISKTTLVQDLAQCNKAIGYKTTALVTAALMGLEIDCRYEPHILRNDNWLDLLPYADWHHTEIENGELWEHLQS